MIVTSVEPTTEYRIYVEEKLGSFDFIEESFECSLTVNHGRGQWVNDGEAFIEDNLTITIVSNDITMRCQIQKFCDDYAETFNQEAVVWTEQRVDFYTREYHK